MLDRRTHAYRQIKSNPIKSNQIKTRYSVMLKIVSSSLFLLNFSPAHANFYDDFSIAGDLHQWVLNSSSGGVFSVSDGELLQTNASPGGLHREIVAKDGYSWSDYTLSFKARVVSGFYSVTSFDIFFRLQNQTTPVTSSYGHPGYFFQLHGGGQVNLFKVDSSGNLVLIQTSFRGFYRNKASFERNTGFSDGNAPPLAFQCFGCFRNGFLGDALMLNAFS